MTIVCKVRKMKGVKKRLLVINILKMSSIFTLHQKLREKFKQFILLTANIHKYKVGEIFLPNAALYIRPKSKVFMFNFFLFDFKMMLKCIEHFYLKLDSHLLKILVYLPQ